MGWLALLVFLVGIGLIVGGAASMHRLGMTDVQHSGYDTSETGPITRTKKSVSVSPTKVSAKYSSTVTHGKGKGFRVSGTLSPDDAAQYPGIATMFIVGFALVIAAAGVGIWAVAGDEPARWIGAGFWVIAAWLPVGYYRAVRSRAGGSTDDDRPHSS